MDLFIIDLFIVYIYQSKNEMMKDFKKGLGWIGMDWDGLLFLFFFFFFCPVSPVP